MHPNEVYTMLKKIKDINEYNYIVLDSHIEAMIEIVEKDLKTMLEKLDEREKQLNKGR